MQNKLFVVLIGFFFIILSCNYTDQEKKNIKYQSETSSAELYMHARKEFGDKNYSEAARLLDSLDSNGGMTAQAYLVQGQIYSKLKDYTRSNKAFINALQSDKNKTGAWFHVGMNRLYKENYREAIEAFKNELEILQKNGSEHPLKNSSILHIGRAYESLAEIDSAEFYYLKSIKEKQNFAEGYAHLGQIYKDDGELQMSLNFYKKAHDLEPSNLEYRFNVGYLSLLLGKLDNAMLHLEIVASRQPWNMAAINSYARLLAATGNTVKAERLLNKTDTLQSLGYEISKLEMGTETYPENEINWIQLGDAYRKLGRFDKAIEAFQVARYLNPENLNTLNKLGNTAYQSGEIRSAITWYNNILSQNPKIPRIWFNLGIAYLSLDQIQDARDAFERVLEMDPDMQLAQEYLTKLSS